MSFTERVLLAIGLVALALLTWYLRDVVLLLFGGIVFATILNALARRVRRYTGVSDRLAVAGSVVLVLIAGGLVTWFIGAAMAEQLSTMSQRVPEALQSLRRWLQDQPLGSRMLELWNTAAESIPWSKVATAAAMTLNALGLFLLMLLLAVFFAAEPQLYRKGFLRLLPPERRSSVDDAFTAAGKALAGWLKGQGVSMLFVGVATGVGLALLGIPLALGLGFIAGLFTFVPFFGPIVSGLLAVLLAFAEGPQKALYVALLMLLIEQVQDNVLMPFVQRWAVALPPVLALISFLVFAALFGPAGMLFATPLMVVLMALVKKLYVEDVLESASHTPRGTR
jgi:predicted PurR-regulated permease PerM